MASINIPQLINTIVSDISALNALIKALAKWDTSGYTDNPEGAMKAELDVSNRLTIKKLVSGTWTTVTKLMHDVDTVDGYHAAVTPAASTVAVRNANGVLQDSIMGNAATATTAASLTEINPVAMGGTGGATSATARANLGVPPTSHASSATTYGISTT